MTARTDLARRLQKRWGCPNAGHTPPARLPTDLDEEARYHAETTGLVPLRTPGAPPPPLPSSHRTCPFARGLSPWARQVARVLRVTAETKGAVSVADILGREPHRWDLAALDAVILARAEVAESDAAIWEREQQERREAQERKQRQ